MLNAYVRADRNTGDLVQRNTPKLGWNGLRLCEIIPRVLITYRVDVRWGVARVFPSVQRAVAAPDCTPLMPIKGSNTRVFSQLCLCVSFIVTYVGGE